MNKTIKTLAMASLAAFTFGFAPSAWADTVAKIIETGTTYDTVQEAINDAEDGQTVQMLADASGNVTITGKAITLDLAGKVLNSATKRKSVITVSGGLTLVDSAPTATHTGDFALLPPGGVITGAKYLAPVLQGGGVNNSGTFTMLGGTIIGNEAGGGTTKIPGYGGGVYNNGTMTVGGTASIRGNLREGVADNLYLPGGKTFSVGTGDAAPKAGMAIGISVATAIASGESLAVTGANAADYHAHFSSDNPAYYVINGENNAVTLSHAPAARNATTGVDYETFQAAVDAASDGNTIQLLRDASGNVTVIGKAITLDLNGKELSAYSDNVITLGDDDNAGTLTLIDGTAVAPETIGAGRITAAPGGTGARGVKVTKSGTFFLTSGRISGCYVIGEDVGGGVYSEGTVIMTGGAIENCRANSGGGVRSWNAFTMSGGVIRGCSAIVGGGIVANDTFNLGGTAIITNNSASLEGGGVYYTPSLTLSGSVIITDNTNSTSGSADNLFARKRLLEQPGCYPFAVADAFDGTIGVTTELKPTKEEPVTFATNVVDAAVAKRFFSDDAQYAVSHTDGNELQLVVPDPIEDCITFSSEGAFSLKTYNATKNWNGTLYWSTDKVNWTEWKGELVSAAQTGDTYFLYVRGDTANTRITGNNDENCRWVLTGSNIACSGNIETLRGATGAEPSTAAMNTYCYTYLFKGCTALTTAPDLSATTLANSCYSQMFDGCTALTTAPVFSATTLADSCCYRMFADCAALTNAPALSATTLANSCYNTMFFNCSSLTEAPELPATTLAQNCYMSMFNGCTALTNAPALPVTTLKLGCYFCMFNGCQSLTEAPALPAETLAAECYYGMFWGCTSLESPAMMDHVTTIGSSACSSMYCGCTKLVVNTASSAGYAKEWRVNASSVVEGWNNEMFLSTAGTFTGAPALNTAYYIKGEAPKPPVATVKIGTGAAVEYTTIEAAWEAAKAGTTTTPATLTLLTNVTVTAMLKGPSNDDFSAIFDLNDKVVTVVEGNDVYIIHQHGKLSVVDNAANKTTKYFEPDEDGRWTRTDAVTERSVQGGYFTGYAWLLMLEGGDVEMSDVSFVGAKRNPIFTQSVDDLIYGKCSFSRVNFLGNVCEDDFGGNPGAISLACKEFQYLFEDCVFRENVSPSFGGAIGRVVVSGEYSTPRLVRCVFENNRSLESDGGAVRLDAPGRSQLSGAVPVVNAMVFEDCVFGGNEAGGNGGAIAAYCNAQVMLKNCVVTNNVASGNGGGISMDGSELKESSTLSDKCVLINTTITDNQASGKGGGVYFARAMACFAAGTRVLMADGTEKPIEEIVEGDVVQTFDHEGGKMSSARVYLASKGEAKELPFTLTFDSGATLSIVGRHDLLEKGSRKYVTISAANAHQYVGAEFYGADGQWHELTGVTRGTQAVDYYSLYTAQHQNVYANGMLTAPDDVDYLLNIYELDENLKADAEQLAADIAQYGLADFDETAARYGISWAWFDDAGTKYYPVAIGKGLATLEGLEALFAASTGGLPGGQPLPTSSLPKLTTSSVSNADPFADYDVGVLTLGANVVIKDNTTGDGLSNVYLNFPKAEEGKTPDLSRIALAADHTGLCVGVATAQEPSVGADVQITTVSAAAGDVACFTSDEGYSVIFKDGAIFLSEDPPLTPVEYREPVYKTVGDPKSGIKEWKTGSVTDYTVVSDQTEWGAAGQTNWYVVASDTTIASRITCVGDVRLILTDGATLNVEAGITASTATVDYLGFTVYAQSEGETMGALVAIESVPEKHAGIGGFYDEPGGMMSCSGSNITINGGTVTVKGGENDEGNSGAGIGGGASGIGSNITINGGTVAATGGQYSAGIGGGQETGGSDITINGGTVTAVGGGRSAGIGGGYGNTGSGITINDGTVTAVGDCGAAAIGGGVASVGSNIAINGGTVFVCGVVARVDDEEGGYAYYCPDVIGSGIASEEASSDVVIAPAAKVFFNLTGIKEYQTENWIEPILPMPESFEGFTIMTPETAVTRVLVGGLSELPGGQPLSFALTNAATEVTGAITVNDEKGVQFANKLLKLPHADSKLTLTAENPPPVATVKIGTGEAVEYTTIEEAWTAACEGTAGKAAVLTLLKDVTTTSTLQATRGSSGDPTVMTLDLNGCVLKAQQPANPADMFNVIDNAGTLTVKDSKFGDKTIPHYFVQTKLYEQYDIWTLTDTPNENVVYGGLITGGAQLDGGEGDVNGGAINNYSAGGSLTIESGNIAGNFVIGAMADGGAIASGVDGATFLMTGGEVCYNSSSVSGGGIIVYEDSGTAAIQGGKIHHNLSASCAGVAASGTATLTISGGEIYGNSAVANGVQGSGSGGGAGVTRNTATLIVEGGKIYDNTADGIGGGGILNNLGTVTITGGEIYGNTASGEGEAAGLGGGVGNTGTMTISGGAIYGNSASTGGAGVANITMGSPATVTMTGGAVTNNSGVAVLNMGAMTLGGTAVIAGMPEYGAPGLYLPIGPSGENYLVTISSETPFTAGAAIGVTTADDPSEGVDVPFTTNGAAGDVDYFTSDAGHFVIFKNGALYLSAPTGIQVGDNAWAELVDGVCTIRGTGATWDGSAKNPFAKDDITSVVIESGITGVGKYFFKFCTRLNSVTGGQDLVAVGNQAFFGCFSLETISLDCNMPEGLDKAVVYQTAIKPSGETYSIPDIKVKNYVKALFGAKAAKNPEWVNLGSPENQSIYETEYNFFQIRLVPAE